MAKLTPEGKVKQKIVAIFKKHGIWYCTPTTYGRGRSGIPDFIACVFGAFLSVEAKAGMNDATPVQLKEMNGIQKSGGWAIVVNEQRLADLEGLITMIIELGIKNTEAAKKRYDEVIEELTPSDKKAIDRVLADGTTVEPISAEELDAELEKADQKYAAQTMDSTDEEEPAA